ncbi:hypothetical protein Mgra_00005811 [Meloidogyne graminicola]|uniref:C2H2-type domain-containing protein n=1 Tax=Meloidogyne graminicola TaxID=189291 RepID=A0A8S9ZNM9_9BILA|nr:hypothetical protein Mgra_00005811 [Meloidogyne graminicola]
MDQNKGQQQGGGEGGQGQQQQELSEELNNLNLQQQNESIEQQQQQKTLKKNSSSVKDENGFIYYKCRFCGLTFNFMNNFKAHERVHDIIQPYTCNKCGESFHYMCELEYHSKTHLKQKGYKCECGRTFFQYTDLLNHRHPGEDPQPEHLIMPPINSFDSLPPLTATLIAKGKWNYLHLNLKKKDLNQSIKIVFGQMFVQSLIFVNIALKAIQIVVN